MKEKLEELFNHKYLKMLEKAESSYYFDEEWDDYLKENNCEVVNEGDDYMITNYCSDNKLIYILDPEESRATYILVPQKFAEKILVLGCLP